MIECHLALINMNVVIFHLSHHCHFVICVCVILDHGVASFLSSISCVDASIKLTHLRTSSKEKKDACLKNYIHCMCTILQVVHIF